MHVQRCRFEGKVAVVTGASSGMGLATAELLGSEGARIVAVGRRAGALEAAAVKIRAAGMLLFFLCNTWKMPPTNMNCSM